MGETPTQPFRLSFNPALKVEFQGSRVPSDGGLILVRELDERLGFRDLITQHLTDPRATNTQFPLATLVRQSVYSRLAGYEDVNDAERLSLDPTFRLIGSEQIWERGAALTSRVHSFETELLTRDENLAGLAAINRELIARVDAPQRVVLDLDSTEIPVYGQQEQSAYNGHFESTCHRFRANEVRLWLSVVAYNLGNLWRRLALPQRIATWSLTSLQHRLMKTGGRLLKHARYYWLLLAEGHLTRRLFGAILRRLVALPGPAG